MKLISILVLAGMLTGCGMEVIGTGARGVKVRLGKVVGEPLPEGLYFHTPLIESIKELNVREVKYEGSTQTYSKDAQIIELAYTVNVKPSATEIHTIYKEVGYFWADVLLKQVLEGNIKEITGKYTAVDLIEKRQQATDALTIQLKTELLKKRIELVSFELNNMDFDDAFEQAVKRKVIAVEQAKEAVNKTVRVKEEASQQVIAAKAEAESMQIRSRALSQNKGLVEYEAVQKWNGVLPQYMMGGATPFINIKGQ